jgi:hypothetical protein
MVYEFPDHSPKIRGSGPGECAEGSGCQGLFDLLMGNHEIGPSCLSSQPNNKQPVVGIGKPHQVISDLSGRRADSKKPVRVLHSNGSKLFKSLD